MTKITSLSILNLVKHKAGTKRDLLFNKPAFVLWIWWHLIIVLLKTVLNVQQTTSDGFFLYQDGSLRCLWSRAYLIHICNVNDEYERMILKKRNKEMFDHSTSTYSSLLYHASLNNSSNTWSNFNASLWRTVSIITSPKISQCHKWRHSVTFDVTASIMTSKISFWRHSVNVDVTVSIMTSQCQ